MEQKFITVGVMGWPVEHSRSPIIHNHWIQKYHLNGSYGLFPVAPSHLEAALRGISVLGLAGCNITIPHKVETLKLVDWVDPIATKVGAVNTVVTQPNGDLHGFNTDVYGYVQGLRDSHPDWRADAGPAVVIGAGGASRAVIVSLLEEGATEIRILNRTNVKAEELAHEFGAKIKTIKWAERNEALSGAALLVNTTNQGMHKQEALDIDLAELPKHALVSDAIYIPLETPLLAIANSRGNPTVNGLGMLINQARLSFQAWFGVMPEITPELNKKIISTF